MKATIPCVREGEQGYGEEEHDEQRVKNAVPVDAGGLFAGVAVAVGIEALRPGGVGREPVDRVGVDDVDLLRVRRGTEGDVVRQRCTLSTNAHGGDARERAGLRDLLLGLVANARWEEGNKSTCEASSQTQQSRRSSPLPCRSRRC